MKKFLRLLFVVVLMFVLVGCGGNEDPADKFDVEDEIKIEEELTTEDVATILPNIAQAYNDVKKIALNISFVAPEVEGNSGKGKLSLKVDASDENNVKFAMEMEVEAEGDKKEMSFYIKDNIMYANVNMEGQNMKFKATEEEMMAIMQEMGGMGGFDPTQLEAMFEELMHELEAEFGDVNLEESLTLGKDKDGNLIAEFEYEVEGEKLEARLVVSSKGLIQYLGIMGPEGFKIEASLQYDASIKYPSFKDYASLSDLMNGAMPQ